MQRITIIKFIVRNVIGASVGWTVKDIIKHNTDPKKKHQQAEAYIGGAVIGKMVSDATDDWVDERFEALESQYNTVKAFFGISSKEPTEEILDTEDTPVITE